MAAVRSGHGRCADLASRLLSGERWIYVDQQSLLKAEGRRFDPAPDHSLTCVNARLMMVLRNAWSRSQSHSARPNHVLSRAYPQVGGFALRRCTRSARCWITSLESCDCCSAVLANPGQRARPLSARNASCLVDPSIGHASGTSWRMTSLPAN